MPNTSFSKFVGAMAPLAPMLTHPMNAQPFKKLVKTKGDKSYLVPDVEEVGNYFYHLDLEEWEAYVDIQHNWHKPVEGLLED